jgi:hypothetical protein
MKRILLIAVAATLALAGGAYGAGTITGGQIKDGTITGADVKNKSLTAADFKGSVQGPAGPQPGERATGAGAHSFTGVIQGSAPLLDPLTVCAGP